MNRVEVSVVVAHYDQPASLALVLAALRVQTLAPERFEVVVADDGSPVPPDVGEQPFRVGVVIQPDLGFRAAAVRNLGVRATTGDLICFLDADTIPEPGYLEAVLAEADRTPDVLVAGRRRHAELQGWGPEELLDWFAGRRPGPPELTEPEWLLDGYRWTDDLRAADDESYRYVIGAVLSVHRSVLERAGGWDERFVGYGGEDYEVVNRCWLAGAELRHVREAVAWHDGPDFSGREVDRVGVQNAQAMALARLLPSEATRPPGLVWEYPVVVVEVDDRGWGEEQALLCLASLLAGTDAGVWLRDGHVARPGGPLGHDPRVHVGAVPADVRRRCRAVVQVDRPVELTEPLRALVPRAPVDVTGLRVRHARRRHAPVPVPAPDPALAPVVDLTRDLDEVLSLGAVLRQRAEATAR
ncbi:glycosyltransferase [Aquipuribacter sp. MA13-6]|uniref:glycosyltransferase n=1 Tax=unclassified Aquipuribacter TaxID=2635084 RepID=UPI003EEC13A4